jgi:GT2 family glycosyltransferase
MTKSLEISDKVPADKILINQVAIVLVTFNRLELLKRLYESLNQQTKPYDKLIIVNNSSTDGTLEWLEMQKELNSKLIIVTQPNSGSSGGQYTAFRTAYELGYEWIWEMDDDILPNSNCLEELFANREKNTIMAPLRIDNKGNIFYNEVIDINLSNPFKSFWAKIIDEDSAKNKLIKVDGLTFEGAFFHRSVISKIGLPDKRVFIFGDDTEFCLRAKNSGINAAMITTVNIHRLLDYNMEQQIHTSKRYYIFRNQIWMDRLYGNFAVRNLRPIIYLLKWIIQRSKNLSDVKHTFKAFLDGIKVKPLKDYYEQ